MYLASTFQFARLRRSTRRDVHVSVVVRPFSGQVSQLEHALLAVVRANSMNEVLYAPMCGLVLVTKVEEQALQLLCPAPPPLPASYLVVGDFKNLKKGTEAMCEMMMQPLMKPFRVAGDMSIAEFNGLLQKAEGRDKLARIFQYSARLLVGSVALLQPTAGTLLARMEGHARTVMVQLASARRTHRWMKETRDHRVVQHGGDRSFKIGDPLDLALDVLQKVSLIAFLITDHIGMLKQWKILSGGKRAGTGTIQLGLKIFTFCNALGVLCNLKKIKEIGLQERAKSLL
eukprot:g31408.t1